MQGGVVGMRENETKVWYLYISLISALRQASEISKMIMTS